ncbi:hypothetical protein D7U02_24655 [Salmonella enterica]|nr:hypothetical protein [Salmonella enterica]
MEKRQRRGLFRGSFFLRFRCICSVPVLKEQLPPAAVSRPERSDRVSEEAAYPRDRHKPPYALMLQTFLPGTFLIIPFVPPY